MWCPWRWGEPHPAAWPHSWTAETDAHTFLLLEYHQNGEQMWTDGRGRGRSWSAINYLNSREVKHLKCWHRLGLQNTPKHDHNNTHATHHMCVPQGTQVERHAGYTEAGQHGGPEVTRGFGSGRHRGGQRAQAEPGRGLGWGRQVPDGARLQRWSVSVLVRVQRPDAASDGEGEGVGLLDVVLSAGLGGRDAQQPLRVVEVRGVGDLPLAEGAFLKGSISVDRHQWKMRNLEAGFSVWPSRCLVERDARESSFRCSPWGVIRLKNSKSESNTFKANYLIKQSNSIKVSYWWARCYRCRVPLASSWRWASGRTSCLFTPPLLYKVVRYYRSPHISTAHPQYLKPAHAPGEACDGAKTTIKPPLKWTRAVRKSFPFTHGGHRAGSACRTPLIVNQGERERGGGGHCEPLNTCTPCWLRLFSEVLFCHI